MIAGRTRTIAIAAGFLAVLSSYASIQITGLNQVPEPAAREAIKDQVELIEKNQASRPLADDASFFLERELRRMGFPDADVQWRFDEASRGITLLVDEGPIERIGTITISGDVAEKGEADLQALVLRATANRNRSADIGKDTALPFVRKDIAAGLAEVAQLYRSLGYWKAETAPLDDSLTARDGLVDVHVQIDAGPLHHFRSFSLTGDTGPDSNELDASLDQLVGKPFTSENVAIARSDVSEFYSKHGYYLHEIEVSPILHSDEIELEFSITAGPSVSVAALRFEGNERLKTDFLEKRFAPLVGKPYSPAETDRIYRDLLGVGLFSRISLEPEKIPGSDDEINLIIKVEEARSRSVGVFGGYGSYDGAILGFIYSDNNVFGNGRQFRASAEYNQRGLRGKIGYHDKWFLNSPYHWDVGLFANTEDHDGYDKSEIGFRTGIGRKCGKHYTISGFASVGYTEIVDAEIDAADLGLTNYRVGSIGLSQTYDTRDSVVLPTKGFVFDNTLEYASGGTGSEVDFLRASARFTAYIPITERTQLSLGARSGIIVPDGDTEDFPIDLRYFSGGGTTVRSFRERHLGPADREGYPLGGEFYTTFNAEYTIQIVGGLKAAVFGDAGNLLRDSDDASLDEMHYAVGAGLRYDLPTGPIRLDYGWNMNRGPREPSGTFHVSVGFAF